MAGTVDFMAYLRAKKEERGTLNDGRERFSRDGDANWARTQAMPFITPMAPPRKGKLLTRSMVHPIGNPYEEDGIKRMAEMGMDVMGYKAPPASAPMGGARTTCIESICGRPATPACRRHAKTMGCGKCMCGGAKKVTPRPRPSGMGMYAPEFNGPPDFEAPEFNAPMGGRRRSNPVRPRPDDYEAPEFNAPIGGRRVVGGRKKSSSWIDHVKAYAAKHGVSYKQAMTDAKSSYNK
jgi:hypothetical protein